MKKFILLFALSLSMSFSLFAQSPVKVAAILKLADNYAVFPKDMYKAMEYALKTIPSSVQIELKGFSHDGSIDSIEKAIVSAKEFGPDVVVAGETSHFAMSIARAFKDKIFITPTASSVKLNDVHPAPVRMTHADGQYAEIAEYLIEKNGFKNIGILHNVSFPNTDRISSEITRRLVEKGFRPHVVKVVREEVITERTLEPFIKNKINTLLFFSFDSDLRKVVSVLKKVDLHPLYIGADGWGRDSFLKEYLLGSSNFHGVRSMYWNEKREDKFFKKVVAGLEDYTGKKADAFHAIGYDTMSFIIQTLTKSSIHNFNRTVLETTYKDVLTSSEISFNASFHPRKDFYLYELKNSSINFLEKIKSK